LALSRGDGDAGDVRCSAMLGGAVILKDESTLSPDPEKSGSVESRCT